MIHELKKDQKTKGITTEKTHQELKQILTSTKNATRPMSKRWHLDIEVPFIERTIYKVFMPWNTIALT